VRFARLDDSTVAVRADATPPGRSRLMLEAALGNAEDGILVLPVKPNAKVPLTGNGLHAATLDRSRIERWWRCWPDANLAMVTGAPGDKASDAQDLRELAEATDLLRDAAAAGDLHDRSRDAQGAPSPTDPYRSSSEDADEAGGTR